MTSSQQQAISRLAGSRVLITGGAGFIATNVIEAIADHCKITVLDTLTRNALSLAPWGRHKNIRHIVGDVQDQSVVGAAVRDADYILHMAAIAGVQTVVRQPAKTLHINLLGTYNVLRAAQKRGRVKRFVDFSTSEVYGPNVFRADEHGMTTLGSVYQPRWFYAVSKLASEFLTHAYYEEVQLPTACIRPFNVYGAYQTGEGAIRNFVLNALTHRPIVVHGEGEQIRSWCYVSDMVDAVLACLTRDAAVGKHFNIGNPRATTSTLELANMVVRLTESKSRVTLRKIKYPDVEVRVPSIAEARRHLGYKPAIGIEAGLQKAIEWYRAHPQLASS